MGIFDLNHYPGVAANNTYPPPFAANVPIGRVGEKPQVSGKLSASR